MQLSLSLFRPLVLLQYLIVITIVTGKLLHKKEVGDGRHERKDREEAKERNKTKSNQRLSGPNCQVR